MKYICVHCGTTLSNLDFACPRCDCPPVYYPEQFAVFFYNVALLCGHVPALPSGWELF